MTWPSTTIAPAAMAFLARPPDPRLSAPVSVEQVMSAQRQRDRLIIMLAGVVVEPVHAQRVLPQPDRHQLVQRHLIVRERPSGDS